MKFLVCLIAVTLASQGVLIAPQDRVHPITQVILGLSELASKDFDFQQLFVALDELAESFQTRKVEENELYEKEYEQYVADQQFYTNQITDLQAKIAQLEVDIKDLTDSRNGAQGYLQEKKAELYDTIKMLNQKNSQISQDEGLFNKQNGEYSDSIAVLDEALALLSEVKDNQSLIQRQENIKETGKKMHKHFTNMKSKRVFFQPLVKALTQLAQNNYVDQDNLKKVMDYMNQLRQSLIDAQTTLRNEFKSQSDIQKSIQAEIQSKVNDLKDVQIPEIQKDIDTKDGELGGLKQILNDANTNLADAQESLNQTNNRWIERTNSHNTLIQQYDNELLVIKDAENALKKGGIFRS